VDYRTSNSLDYRNPSHDVWQYDEVVLLPDHETLNHVLWQFLLA
jgi:hypothetical protein